MGRPDVADAGSLVETLAGEGLDDWARALLSSAGSARPHGDLQRWAAAVDGLPELAPVTPAVAGPAVALGPEAADAVIRQRIRDALLELIPWRKGPFRVHGVDIDAEWRSDLKWGRVAPHVDELTGRRVLDVGCGNGYYALRMLASGARWVLGADPTTLFALQYRAIRRFTVPLPFWLLPVPLENLPEPPRGLDTVFSMGVMYHRRSPLGHLARLRRWLRPGGQLVLETLVTDGGPQTALVPPDRYARMPNVWFLPSVESLLGWVARAGFADARCVDVSATTVEEQRSTEWMPFESLAQALDASDPSRTVEGHPAPRRAIVTANRSPRGS